MIKNNKSAIVLVPEISLTPQMANRFVSRFGQNVSILHSKLSARRRYEEWKRIKDGEVQIVVGARSAIFAPFKNIGVIIIDEEHDSSYISGNAPKYDAKEIAKYFAKVNRAMVIYASATPKIETYYKAHTGEIKLYKLLNRVNNQKMPECEIIDLRFEKDVLSKKLIEELKENKEKGNQSIIFLNRRGHSSMTICTSCGYTAKCKRCNISLTMHQKEGKLKCHYCGYTEPIKFSCPVCGSENKTVGMGTEQLEAKLKKLGFSTIRMDLDTTKNKNTHEEILEKFKTEKIDVLVGTQMITKGHHFPKVTISTVAFADSMINIDSYRATETAFQNIVQVLRKSRKRKRRKSNNSDI